MPRRMPYTERGIRRLRCWVAGCDRRAEHQWQCCADGNVYRGICLEHDIALNDLALRFVGDPDREAKMAVYRAKMGA